MAMADPVYPDRQMRSRDPLDPLEPRLDPERELPEHATPSSLGRIPVGPERVNPRLNNTAESMGSALGAAVVRLRKVPDRLQDAKRRFTVIRGRKQQEASEAADEAIERIRDASAEMKEKARLTLRDARFRGVEYAYRYPLEAIAGAAAFGLLMGIGLRLWRDHAS
jgi:ElaB/YqjD/DUF883 family membrane-anchored ribosome-binding protein